MQPALNPELGATPPGPALVTSPPLPADAPEQIPLLRILEVVRDRVDAIHAGQRALSADMLDLKKSLPIQRRALSPRTQEIHIRATWLKRTGCCPLCESVQVCSESGRVGDAEFDHAFSRNNNRVTATWLLCKSCHARITNDTHARAESMAAFRVYQQALRPFLGNRQMPLGLTE